MSPPMMQRLRRVGRRGGLVLSLGAVGLGWAGAGVAFAKSPGDEERRKGGVKGWIRAMAGKDSTLDEARLERLLRTAGIGGGVMLATAAVTGQVWRRFRRPPIPGIGLILIPNFLCIYWPYIEETLAELGTESEKLVTMERFMGATTFVCSGIGLGVLWLRLGPQTPAAVAKGAALASALVPLCLYSSLAWVPAEWSQSAAAEGVLYILGTVGLCLVLVRETARLSKHALRGRAYKTIPVDFDFLRLPVHLPQEKETLLNATTNVVAFVAAIYALVGGVHLFRREMEMKLDEEATAAEEEKKEVLARRLQDLEDLGLATDIVESVETRGLQYVWTPALLVFVTAVEIFIGMI